MKERQEYLVRFLRGCADAADKNELGVPLGELLLNGDLIREAANEFETLIPEREGFKSFSDEMQFNIVRAELHARQAHDLCYQRGGERRSLWFKMALGRAQSILMSLYTQERRRTG